MRSFFVVAVLLSMLVGRPEARAAGDLTGVWEIGSLGADRRVEVWQNGDEFIAYRVLYPEFEGEKYKLEHLYRGKLSGTKIEGTILVKEEGMRDFDTLRSFVGRVDGQSQIALDGFPLKKLAGEVKSKPPKLKRKKKRNLRGNKVTTVFSRSIPARPGGGPCFAAAAPREEVV